MLVYLSLGSNLGNKIENINTAIRLISKKISVPQKISNYYISEPWGFVSENYFINNAIEIETDFSAQQLLQKVSEIEKQMKRIINTEKYEDRIIDIDIIFYGNEIFKTNELQIPHQKLQERLFVLMPLNEICPCFIHPVLNKTVSELFINCSDKSAIKFFLI